MNSDQRPGDGGDSSRDDRKPSGLTSTGLVLGNPEGVEDFSGVVGDGGLGFDRVTVDGDGDGHLA